jgi:ABC-type glycerol-3-phosphate transport system substrate-binding protein
MEKKTLSRRDLLHVSALTAVGGVLAACQPKVVEKIVERTVVVEKAVKETVVVKEAVEVSKEVTRVVEKEVVKTQDTVLLRWHHRLGTEWDMYAEAIKMFKDSHPNVIVNEEVIPATNLEYGPKLVTMIAGGVAGDIAWMANGSGSFQFFSMSGAMTALEPFVDAEGSAVLEEYFPEAVGMFTVGPEGVGTGDLFCLPELAQAGDPFLFYNQTLLESENLAVPTDDWTRDGLLEAALKATTPAHYGLLPRNLNSVRSVLDNLLPYGLLPFKNGGRTSTLNEEDVKSAMRWVNDLFNKHKVAPRAQDIQGSSAAMFAGNQLAMIQSGVNTVKTFRVSIADRFNWDMVLMAKGPTGSRGQFVSGDGEGILKDSKNKETAWQFIRTVTSTEPQVLLLLEIGLASRPDAYTDPRTVNEAWLQRQSQMLATSAPFAGPNNLRQQECNAMFDAIFAPAINGEREADDAFFDEAHAKLQEFLDKPREGVQ